MCLHTWRAPVEKSVILYDFYYRVRETRKQEINQQRLPEGGSICFFSHIAQQAREYSWFIEIQYVENNFSHIYLKLFSSKIFELSIWYMRQAVQFTELVICFN